MKQLKKHIIPILHALKTIHHSIGAVLSAPAKIVEQEKDWKFLTTVYPTLHEFFSKKIILTKKLKSAYEDYVTNYSAPLISMSLSRGVFLYYFCQTIKPNTILDLGSGFSSYVFRSYANGDVKVISVDDSKFWLNETKVFLEKYEVQTNNLLTWECYEKSTDKNFDLAFLDIGNLDFRLKILPELLEDIKSHGGILIVDDYHVPHYRKSINQLCQAKGLNIISLRKVTRTRLNHNAMIYSKLV